MFVGLVALIHFPNLPFPWNCLVSELELVERCVTRGDGSIETGSPPQE